jgi:hypothetical protein
MAIFNGVNARNRATFVGGTLGYLIYDDFGKSGKGKYSAKDRPGEKESVSHRAKRSTFLEEVPAGVHRELMDSRQAL